MSSWHWTGVVIRSIDLGGDGFLDPRAVEGRIIRSCMSPELDDFVHARLGMTVDFTVGFGIQARDNGG
jgi:hypothetical protein